MRAYERLLKYITYPTTSDPESASCPSTGAQRVFGDALVEEMRAMGIADACIDENGYVMGTVPGNTEGGPVIGFIAHMDTSNDAPGEDIHARIVRNYSGGDIPLDRDGKVILSPKTYEVLEDYIGDDLIVGDGRTLLGCDDKCGIAEILTMAEQLLADPGIPHGHIKIGFTPDEEIGRGADLFDVVKFGADFAYTVDGAGLDGISHETFNAAAAQVTVTGFSIHPGSAKNKLLNASLIAMEFHSMLPAAERPEHTEGYDGFYHLLKMDGHVEEAALSYIIRDHDMDILNNRKAALEDIAAYLNKKYGEGTVKLEIADSYPNMAMEVGKHPHLLEIACKAVEAVGGKPRSVAIRGGTDGSKLSFMGLPCPNLGTGSHNHHGRMEFASVQAMDKCTGMLVEIARMYAGKADTDLPRESR